MLISPTNRPQVFITMGDPSGIGPEVIMRSMASPGIEGLAIFIIVGDAGVIENASRTVYNGNLAVHMIGDGDERIVLDEGRLNVLDPGPALCSVAAGMPTDEGAAKALKCLDAAVRSMEISSDETPKALVTAPVSKERIARIFPGFIGHTEYLRDLYSAEMVTMVMAGKNLCVVPVTRHIPLKDVAGKLSAALITRTLVQVAKNRKIICGREDARIGVCALNPHCGEGGRIGDEEGRIIAPAISEAKDVYGAIEGPMPADVIFYKAISGHIDIVVGMYHDQCLAPFKMVDFDNGVNMTLGLRHVRTSPDHGTAFDIAGKGTANPSSMIQAIKLALRAIGVL
ncbi:MAG: 4-hydroxythreonine-4-phosphate dehydrogenase PdxA [Candidatus Omnitrophota bacterium]